ncbi:MAG: ATP synthase F1 subunit gamma [Lachnospiraceae bacterium]|nr:ATP synthase F1 subunit gamma [Lachnospiraceae bacterium]
MASMSDLKKRRASISSTGQITKAMKLVSTVKLQKTRVKAEHSKPYFRFLYDTVTSIIASSPDASSPYLTRGVDGKIAVVAITSNRGLAGGYNNNIVKLVTSWDVPKEDLAIYAVGTKGRDGFIHRGYNVVSDMSELINAPMFLDALYLCQQLLDAFRAGEIREIYLAYTSFKNTMVQEPILLKLLPLQFDREEIEKKPTFSPMNYEPSEEEVLAQLIPQYMAGILHGAFIEAIASENAARMQAMDNATKNAEEMMEDLELEYNRARQSSITQELTEIIAGANAIS